LVCWFSAQGDEVVALVRRTDVALGVKQVLWDGETLGPWAAELEGAEAVINLAGRSVDCRYHAENRRQILESRLGSTRVLGRAIAECARPPAVWLNSSSATIYRHAEDRPMDEANGEIGSGFSVDVCLAWEAEAMAAPAPKTRRVLLRTAMVLGRDGGVFVPFRLLARLGLGGTLAGGRQYMSWLHDADFARAIDWLIAHREVEGPVNLAAPNPIPNAEWMRLFRERFGPGIGLPAARWMLEIGAFFLRTETELLLKSRRVVPGRLLAGGFRFEHPTVASALDDLRPANPRESGRPLSVA
jgi:uncharacterized protein (TIGR01777 family)